jgi:hypothetical protein
MAVRQRKTVKVPARAKSLFTGLLLWIQIIVKMGQENHPWEWIWFLFTKGSKETQRITKVTGLG